MSWSAELTPCSWRGVTFNVLDMTDTRTRRRARYGYPYKNGEDLEDLGREGRPTSFTAVFRGPSYLSDLAILQQQVDTGKVGTFQHPLFGSWQARLDITINHTPDARDQCTVGVDVLEDGTDAEVTGGFSVELAADNVTSSIAALQAVMAAIQQAASDVETAVDDAIERAEEVKTAVDDATTEIDRKMNETRARVAKARALAEAAYPPNVAGKVKRQLSIMARRSDQLAEAAKFGRPRVLPERQRIEGPLHLIVAGKTGGQSDFDAFRAMNRIRNPNRVKAGTTVATYEDDPDD